MIDLKTKKITHQDVGQMDMYVRMYDELKKHQMIIQQFELFYVLKLMKILQNMNQQEKRMLPLLITG